MADILNTIAAAAAAEPVELPRLTTAQVFVNYEQMGKAIERIADAYKSIPGAAQQSCASALKEIVQQCESVSKKALRLLEANQ